MWPVFKMMFDIDCSFEKKFYEVLFCLLQHFSCTFKWTVYLNIEKKSHILDIIWGRTGSWRIFKISSEVMLKICSYLDGSKSGKIAPRTACTTHSSSHKFLACKFNKCHFNILILNTICFKRVTYSHHQWRKWTIKIISILV